MRPDARERSPWSWTRETSWTSLRQLLQRRSTSCALAGVHVSQHALVHFFEGIKTLARSPRKHGRQLRLRLAPSTLHNHTIVATSITLPVLSLHERRKSLRHYAHDMDSRFDVLPTCVLARPPLCFLQPLGRISDAIYRDPQESG